MGKYEDMLKDYRQKNNAKATQQPQTVKPVARRDTSSSDPYSRMLEEYRKENGKQEQTASGDPYSDMLAEYRKKNNPPKQTLDKSSASAAAEAAQRRGQAMTEHYAGLRDLREQRARDLAELNELEANAGYVTDADAGLASASRRKELAQALEQADAALGIAPRYYTEADRMAGALAGSVIGWGATHSNTVGTLASMAGAQDETGRAIADSAYAGYFTDPVSMENARAEVEKGWKPESTGFLKQQEKIADAAFSAADRLDERSRAYTARAKEGASKADRLLVDLTQGAVDLAGDTLASAILPGSGLLLMASRSFGGEAMQRRHEGADISEQVLAGAKSAAIEILTEKIGGPFERAYGGTLLGKKTAQLVEKLGKNPSTRRLLSLLGNGLSEGFEEILSDVLNPAADRLLNIYHGDQGYFEQIFSKDFMMSSLYDGVLGGLLGMAGGVSNIARNGGDIKSPQAKAAAKQAGAEAAQAAIDQAIEKKTAEADKAALEQDAPQAPQEAAGEPVAQGNTDTAPKPAETPTEAPALLNSQENATEAEQSAEAGQSIDERARRIYETPYEDEFYGTQQREDWGSTGEGAKLWAYLEANGVDSNSLAEGSGAESRAFYELLDLLNHGGDLPASAVAQAFAEAKTNGKMNISKIVSRAYEIAGEEMPSGVRAQYAPTAQDRADRAKLDESYAKEMASYFDTLAKKAEREGNTEYAERMRQRAAEERAKAKEAARTAAEAAAQTEERAKAKEAARTAAEAAAQTEERAAEDVGPYEGAPGAEQPAEEGLSPEDKQAADELYNELGQQYGTIEEGENAARESNVPRQTGPREKVGEAVRTMYEAEAIAENRLQDIRNAVVNGDFSFETVTDEALTRDAENKIKKDGWEGALRDWTADVRSGKANENLVAMGATLLNNAANSGMDGKSFVDMAVDYNELCHRLGRGLEAARILKRLSPSARLYALQKTVSRINEERSAKKSEQKKAAKEAADIKLDPELAEAFLNAETDAERDAIISQMQQRIADQIPATLMEKWNALRYMNMLGNFKTQGRNLAGNATMMVTAAVKNHLVRGTLEGLYGAVNKNYEKTSAVAYNPRLFAEAFNDWKTVKDEAMGEKKYSDAGRQFEKGIQEKRRIFKFEPLKPVANLIGKVAPGAKGVADKVSKAASLEGYRLATNWAMDMGDQIFSVMTYADAMASWMQAHKVKSISEMSPEMLERARQHAIKEAQEATFRDTNGVSKWASGIGRGNTDSGFGKFMNTVTEGILPFRKTPANVLVRAWEYSPLGTLTGIGKKAAGVTDAQGFINDLSKSFTGSGLAVLGYLLAAAGKIRTPDDDDKLEAFRKEQGQQDYSYITDDGKSVTLDWLAPDSIPLFMGATAQKVLSQGGLTGDQALKILGQITDPMLEMSMLSGVNDALEMASGYSNDMDALPSLVLNSVLGYMTQGWSNSLLRQAEQASEEVRRSSYTNKESGIPSVVQRKISQYFGGIPGIDVQQTDYIDGWGRKQQNGSAKDRVTQAFFNPAYTQEDRSTPYDKELERLYEAGALTQLPTAPSRSTDVEKQRLTPEEYETYATVAGQKKLELVGDFLDSEEYKNLNDEERAEIIGNLYEYANYQAKKAVMAERGGKLRETSDTKSMEKLVSVEKAGVDVYDYLLGKKNANEDGKDSLKAQEIYDWLAGSGYNEKQKAAIWDANKGQTDKTWNQYYNSNPVTILANYGLEGKEARDAIDRLGFDSGSVKTVENMGKAYNSGVSADKWADAYEQHKIINEDASIKLGQKAETFARYLEELGLTKAQQNILRDQMKFYSTISANTEKFDALSGVVGMKRADRLTDDMSGLTKQNDKLNAINSLNYLTDEEKWKTLEYFGISDACLKKAMDAKAKGWTFDQWVQSYTKGK